MSALRTFASGMDHEGSIIHMSNLCSEQLGKLEAQSSVVKKNLREIRAS